MTQLSNEQWMIFRQDIEDIIIAYSQCLPKDVPIDLSKAISKLCGDMVEITKE